MENYLPLIFLGIFGISAISAGVFVFFTKNVLHALYAFMAILLSVAGVFVLSGADFVAVSQIMIYVGGILVLLLFGIMLGAAKKLKSETLKVANVNALWSMVMAVFIFGLIVYLINKLEYSSTFAPDLSVNSVKVIGMSFLTNYLLVLEGLGVLLLIALIGSTLLASDYD